MGSMQRAAKTVTKTVLVTTFIVVMEDLECCRLNAFTSTLCWCSVVVPLLLPICSDDFDSITKSSSFFKNKFIRVKVKSLKIVHALSMSRMDPTMKLYHSFFSWCGCSDSNSNLSLLDKEFFISSSKKSNSSPSWPQMLKLEPSWINWWALSAMLLFHRVC